MTQVAKSDETRTDEFTGLEHKLFAGQPIPPNVMTDEEREAEDNDGEPDVIGASKSTPDSNVVIADSDDEREDPNTGLTHKVIAGQPIPPNLMTDEEKGEVEEEQEEEAEEESEEEQPAANLQATRRQRQRQKVQTAPDKER